MLRPAGYSFLIDLVPGRDIRLVTALQHLAGLGIGTLVYALLVRFDAPRWLAVAAAALILFDARLLALEHYVLTETTFALLLLGGAALALWDRDKPWLLAAGGVAIGLTPSIRTTGLFAVAVFLAFVLLRGGGARRIAIGCVAVLLPVAGYVAYHEAETGRLGFTRAEGWFLYGRAAQLGPCGDADVPADSRPLCRPGEIDNEGLGDPFFLFYPESPAIQELGLAAFQTDERANRIVRGYATAVIRDRPLEYLGLVAGDVGRYFVPGIESPAGDEDTVRLYADADNRWHNPEVEQEVLPDLALSFHWPGRALVEYSHVARLPRPLLGVLALLALLALALAIPRRTRAAMRHRDEVLLLSGTGIAVLVGSTLASDMVVRYLVPLGPLLVTGGVLAARDLIELARR